MSGYQLAEAARRLRPGLRVLFASGYAAELSEHDGRHMLRKPYDRRELSQAVRTALDALVEFRLATGCVASRAQIALA